MVLALAACASGTAAPAPTVTATHTVTSTSTHTVVKTGGTTEPAPTVTNTVTQRTAAAPAPTVTNTVTQTAAAPAPTVTQTASAPAPSQSAGGSTSGGSGKGHVIARFNGSGTQNTASFTTPDSWALSWSYWGCTSNPDNFIVTEYNSDGSIDVNGVSVNELGAGRGPVATYAYGDAGTHYFSVDSGCSWSLVPVTV
jgi:hypothetical protein